MKIALLSRWYWEENRRFGAEGGPVRQLAEAVAARGHEVVVLSQSPEVNKLRKGKIGELETWLSPRDRKRSFVIGWRDKLAKKTYNYRKLHSDAHALNEFLTRRGPFDVLWAQTESPDGLIAAFAQELGFEVPPFLLQLQALRYRFERGQPVFTEKAPLMLAFRHATRIIANSEMVAGYLGAYTGPALPPDFLAAKVRVAYPNLARSFLEAAMEDPLQVAPREDRVLFLGALNPGKGALVFLKALPKTEMSKRSAVFAVIGDFTEDNKRFAQRWAEQQETTRIQTLGARIEYLGKVSPEEVIRQIRLAQAVVIPSLFDAFNRGLVEALLLGRPVVTTDRVGAAALVHAHQCGIVVPPNDPDSLGHAIDAVTSPLVPFAWNAAHVGPQLIGEFTPETAAERMEHDLAATAGFTAHAEGFEPQPTQAEPQYEPEPDEQPQEPDY
jgi:glycosyltransferase involved in cell wall biosynthesis